MASGRKLLILAVTTLVAVVTQAQSGELDGLPPACPRIGWGLCVAHLTGRGSLEGCCFVLNALGSKECQCWAMESISNGYESVDKEYARNLPRKCGTSDESCSFKMPYIYM